MSNIFCSFLRWENLRESISLRVTKHNVSCTVFNLSIETPVFFSYRRLRRGWFIRLLINLRRTRDFAQWSLYPVQAYVIQLHVNFTLHLRYIGLIPAEYRQSNSLSNLIEPSHSQWELSLRTTINTHCREFIFTRSQNSFFLLFKIMFSDP